MKPAPVNMDHFAAAVSALPAGNLTAKRQHAASVFARSGFPTTRDEAWKYTNLSGATDLSNAWLESATHNRGSADSKTQNGQIEALVKAVDAHWLIVENGICTADAIAAVAGEAGIELSLLSSADTDIDMYIDDALSAFNAALIEDGVHIKASKDAALKKPLGLIFADHGDDQVSQCRIVIDCEEESNLQIFACELSGDSKHFSNRVCQAHLARNARLDYVRLQDESTSQIATNRFQAELATGAELNHAAFDFGGSLIRNDVDIRISEAGAIARLHGLYLAAGHQHIDNHLRVVHETGPAISEQNYRGILNGRARCVFNGKAEVLQGADGTDASQANHNLLLSRQAEIDTKPELEIYADDVKCSHGATVGQLDTAALFYLQSRGIGADEAKRMVMRAFVAEIADSIVIGACADFVSGILEHRLNEILEDGKND